MGDTYHLGCTQCKEQIWIGQRVAGSRGLFLYGGIPPIEKFLVAHRGHPLIFDALVAFEGFRELELGQDGILHPLPGSFSGDLPTALEPVERGFVKRLSRVTSWGVWTCLAPSSDARRTQGRRRAYDSRMGCKGIVVNGSIA